MDTDADAVICKSAPARRGTKRKTEHDADSSDRRVKPTHEMVCALLQIWKYNPLREEIRVIYGPSNKIHAMDGLSYLENPLRAVFRTVFTPNEETKRRIRISEDKAVRDELIQHMPTLMPVELLYIIADYDAREVRLFSHFSGWTGSVLLTCDSTGLDDDGYEQLQQTTRCIECPVPNDTRIRRCVHGEHACALVKWDAPF